MAIVDLPGDSSSGLLPDALLPAGLVLGSEQILHGREGKVEEVGNILPTVLRPVFALLVSCLQGHMQPMKAGLPRPCWRGGTRDTEDLGPLVGRRRESPGRKGSRATTTHLGCLAGGRVLPQRDSGPRPHTQRVHLLCPSHPRESKERPSLLPQEALDTWLGGGLPWQLWTPTP